MLPFSVSLRAGVPIHDQLVLAVRRAVVSGQLRPGEPFPSVRSLSQELGINPNTAHKAVATLVADGILAVKPGVGTVIADHPYDTRSERRQVLGIPDGTPFYEESTFWNPSWTFAISGTSSLSRRSCISAAPQSGCTSPSRP